MSIFAREVLGYTFDSSMWILYPLINIFHAGKLLLLVINIATSDYNL
jgi:hypothetical protein